MAEISARKSPLPPVRSFTKIPGTPNGLIGRTAKGVVSSPDEPDLILICGGMGAQLPHLFKYTEGYNEIYPGATQIIVRGTATQWINSKKTSAENLVPVAKLLRDYDPSRILLHVFSNSGCLTVTTLSDALAMVRSDTFPARSSLLPAAAVIFDSCPGDSNIVSACHAFTAQIRNTLSKYIAVALFCCAYAVIRVVGTISGQPQDIMEPIRGRLLDPGVLSHSIPRTFFYSESDDSVPFQTVETHVERAKAIGINVATKKFSNTPHVNHVKGDSAGYWDLVVKTWERSYHL